MKIARRTKIIGLLLTVGLFVALHFARAQATADTGSAVMTDSNEDVSNLSDLAVELKALEMATPIAASNEPSVGNFYSAQHAPGSAEEWPPMPGNIFGLPVWPLDTNIFVIDDLGFRYNESSAKTTKTANGIEAEDDFVVPSPPGGGSDTNTYNPPILTDLMPDYGTNLFIVSLSMVSGNLTGVASNTLADVEYAVQTNSDLLNTTNWADDGQFIQGSEVTNWTQFILQPPPTTNNLFFRLQSWASSDGSGIPSWWELKYLGQDTNVDPYADPTGDGYTLLQDFQNGFNPNVYRTPPAPQLTVSYNEFAFIATLNWSPVLTPATSYTVERFQVDGPLIQTNVFNLSGSTNSLQDSLSDADNYVNLWGPSTAPAFGIYYQIQAHYASGDSAWSAPVYVQPNAPATISLITGPQQTPYLAVASLPAGTTALEILQIEPEQPSFNLTNVIEVASSTNGFYPMPAAVTTNPSDTGYVLYNWYVELLDTNGQSSGNPLLLTGEYTAYGLNNGGATNWMVAPYFDGRVQMKQNLAFLLRAAVTDIPFQFTEETALGNYPTFTSQTNFVISDFYSQNGYGDYSFAPLQPFIENYLLRNFAFASPDEGTGGITTGVSGDYDNYYDDPSDNPTPLILADSATYQLSVSILEAGSIPALLDTNTTQWQCSYALDSPSYEFDANNNFYSPYLGKIGVAASLDANSDLFYTMTNGVRNYWGLPFLSTTIAYPNSAGTAAATTVLNAGSQVENVDGDFYPQTAQPQFQTAEYDFWAGTDALPESANFSTTNQSDNAIIVPVGQSTQVFGYAKLAVRNGYPGVYGYLGQYFTNAYEIGTNRNTTGVLSPYGNFFATQPGPVALVTMPDPDTGLQGTGIVNCVSLNVDKNHDGIMDLSFNGPDVTSQASPMEFWINNDNDGTGIGEDIDAPQFPDSASDTIQSMRGLEDFARLWICGVPALTNDYQVTLSWTNISSGNPSIKIFPSREADGGTEYLTETNLAQFYVDNPLTEPCFGAVTNGENFQFPVLYFTPGGTKHLIFEGVTAGTGELMLTITDSNGNQIAQTGVWLDLHDVKDLYEQAHIAGIPSSNFPVTQMTNASTFVSDHELPANLAEANQMIVFVHGWRMGFWDYQNFSDTMFKRLYWAGYQGRFAALRWPTLSKDDYNILPEVLSDEISKSTYNRSEYIAHRSADGTSAYFDWLKSRLPDYTISVAAHSMGNIVMMDTLKLQLAAGSHDIDNYVMMQAAVPAHCYDTTLPNYSLFTTAEVTSPTPDIYRGYPGDISAAVNGQITDFFNTNDFALVTGTFLGYNVSWEGNEVTFKPDYVWGYTSDGTNCYQNTLGTRLVTDPREQMAFVARPRSKAAGGSAGVASQVDGGDVDLTARFNFQNNYYEHSAEFNYNIQRVEPFYVTLLSTLFPPE